MVHYNIFQLNVFHLLLGHTHAIADNNNTPVCHFVDAQSSVDNHCSASQSSFKTSFDIVLKFWHFKSIHYKYLYCQFLFNQFMLCIKYRSDSVPKFSLKKMF